MSWVLKEHHYYLRRYRFKDFKGWGQIGPRRTTKIEEAEHFKTKKEAMRSNAYFFALWGFEPVMVVKREKS